jgi:xylulose-5-phosphate/fructose-6-phosphate phosphoketolase
MANPLLREPLRPEHIKPRLLGHWGTSPGLAFIYTHVSRLIRHTGQKCLFITGPGHGGPALVGASYLEETYADAYPHITYDDKGLLTFFRQFSAPGGIPSHVSVTTPGSIHEGGELGYALIHAFGAAFDNPDLLTVAVVGDGEAETGPLEGSWKGISFLNPAHDGPVCRSCTSTARRSPRPTVLARKPHDEVEKLFEGYGYEVLWVEGDDLPGMHFRFAEALSVAYDKIQASSQPPATGRRRRDGRSGR